MVAASLWRLGRNGGCVTKPQAQRAAVLPPLVAGLPPMVMTGPPMVSALPTIMATQPPMVLASPLMVATQPLLYVPARVAIRACPHFAGQPSKRICEVCPVRFASAVKSASAVTSASAVRSTSAVRSAL